MVVNGPAWGRRFTPRLSMSRAGVLKIAAGTAGAQGLALASAPLLSRLYGPSDFGVFTVVSSLTAIGATVGALRFELAVPLPEKERDAQGLVALGLLSTVLTCAVIGTAVALGGSGFAQRLGLPGLTPWLWTVPAITACMSAYLVLNQLAIRHRRYGAIARRNLLQSVAAVGVQVVAGLAGYGAPGLIAGLGAGQATSAMSLVRGSSLFGADAKEGRRCRRLALVAKRYRRFPLLLAPSGLLNVMGLQLPVVLIASWYGSSVAGWLGLTQRVLALPVMLVGAAVAQVYVAELARAARDNHARAVRLFVLASQRLSLVAAVIAVVLLALAPALFGPVFGPDWVTSGVYAQALAVGLATQLVAVPVSQTLIVFERQVLQLVWDTSRLAMVTGAVCVVHVLGGSALTAVWTYGIASACAYAASWLISLGVVRHSREWGRSSAPGANADQPRGAAAPTGDV